MKNIFIAFAFCVLLSSFLQAEEKINEYPLSFGLGLMPALSTNNLETSFFDDINAQYGNFMSFGAYAYLGLASEYIMIKGAGIDFCVNSKIGYEYLSGSKTNSSYIGSAFVDGALGDVALDNNIDISYSSILFDVGLQGRTKDIGLKYYLHIGADYIISPSLEESTELANDDFLFEDGNSGYTKKFDDVLNSLNFNLILGGKYNIFEYKNVVCEAELAAKIPITSRLTSDKLYNYSLRAGLSFTPIRSKKKVEFVVIDEQPEVKQNYELAISHTVIDGTQTSNDLHINKARLSKYFFNNPILNYNDSEVIPKHINTNYSSMRIKRYVKEENQDKRINNGDYYSFYSNLLNIAGNIVYNDINNKITIYYTNNKAFEELSLKRVKHIEDYFYNSWNISRARLKHKPKAIDRNSLQIDYNGINQPYEIESDIELKPDADFIEFSIVYPNEEIESWELRVQQAVGGDIEIVYDETGFEKNKTIKIDLKEYHNIVKSETKRLEYSIKVKMKDGEIKRSDLQELPLQFSETGKKSIYIEGKLSDMKENKKELNKILKGAKNILLMAYMNSVLDQAKGLISGTYNTSLIDPKVYMMSSDKQLNSDFIRITFEK